MKIRNRTFEARELRLNGACAEGMAYFARNMGWIGGYVKRTMPESYDLANNYVREWNPIVTIADVDEHSRGALDVLWVLTTIRTHQDPDMLFPRRVAAFFGSLWGVTATHLFGVQHFVDAVHGDPDSQKNKELFAFLVNEMLDSESSVEAISRIEMALRKMLENGELEDSLYRLREVERVLYRRS